MSQKRLSKGEKIFKEMSLVMGTRNNEQCRSHHQKLMKRHKSLDKIICYFKNKRVEEMKKGKKSSKGKKVRVFK